MRRIVAISFVVADTPVLLVACALGLVEGVYVQERPTPAGWQHAAAACGRSPGECETRRRRGGSGMGIWEGYRNHCADLVQGPGQGARQGMLAPYHVGKMPAEIGFSSSEIQMEG
jgi:hypothetical protein